MKRLLVLLSLLLCAPVFGQDPTNYFKSAFDKQSQGDLDGALADYSKGIELNPNEPLAFLQRGMVKFEKWDVDGALADTARALELKPDLVEGYVNRGNIKQYKGDLDGALADCAKAIQLKPDCAEAYNNRGNVKKSKGDLDGALADYRRAIELKPDSALTFISRGCLRYDQHQFTEATADFRKAVEIDPYELWGNCRLLISRARMGEQKAATEALQHKARIRNEWPISTLLFLTDELTEADFFKTATNTNKRIENGWRCTAYFYGGTKCLIVGDKIKARDYFEKCVTMGVDAKASLDYQSALAELKFLNATK